MIINRAGGLVLMQEKSKCVLCKAAVQETNIGIRILGKYICTSCEQKIINLSWDDPDYEAYKSGLKKIWRFNEA
ncbi:hypothetical protein Dred_0056 [Desulforamulus reducens MI-1]|uniref:Inhibitor of sigma-G Gin n=2 Tax=Desulforamulus TaxID=2916693 RepID=A4J0K3_DESRM|nr:hypothetical protein Dred_0056 [Desulforamulus reducens MI-1]